MSTISKVPFESTDSNKFNRWAVIIGLVLLAMIAAVIVFPPIFNGVSTVGTEASSAAAKVALESQAVNAASESVRYGFSIGKQKVISLKLREISMTEAIALTRALYTINAAERISQMEKLKATDGNFFVFESTGTLDSGGSFHGVVSAQKSAAGEWTAY